MAFCGRLKVNIEHGRKEPAKSVMESSRKNFPTSSGRNARFGSYPPMKLIERDGATKPGSLMKCRGSFFITTE